MGGSADNPAVRGDGHHLPGDLFPAGQQGPLGGVLDAAAARNLHADDGQALNVVVCQDLGELLAVVPRVQLGAADEGYPAPDKVLVEIAVGMAVQSAAMSRWAPLKYGAVGGTSLICTGHWESWLGTALGTGAGAACSR